MNSIKQKLLDLGLCIENDYLDLYVNLIVSNLNQEKMKDKTQLHHIIPRYYFKLTNINVDNSKSNLVNLTFEQHVLAHYYLMRCSKTNELAKKNAYALIRWVHSCDLQNIKLDGTYNKLYEEIQNNNRLCHLGTHHTTSNKTKEKISAANKNVNKGKIYIHKGDCEKRVYRHELYKYINSGYVEGRSDKTCKSLSKNYNYSVKGMLGKKQSNYQKSRVSQALKSKPKSQEARLNMSIAKSKGDYVCMRDKSNTKTIRVCRNNAQKYIQLGFIPCK